MYRQQQCCKRHKRFWSEQKPEKAIKRKSRLNEGMALIFSMGAVLVGSCPTAEAESLKMVPFDQVRMEDVIWAPRTKQLAEKTLPHALKQTEVAQVRLRLCAEWLESGGTTPLPEPHRFNTSDLYKVMEGAAMMIKSEPNPQIEEQLDRIIDWIARAQKDDGYLYIVHIVGNANEKGMGDRPYSYVFHSHELYNIGHLYEAAAAYAQATGKTKLLDVAEKSARHVNRVFFEGDPNYNGGKPVNQAPGHQEIEIGLVKLYNYTGNKLYLDMAKKFLDIRGVTFVPEGDGVMSGAYAQQHKPVSEQTEAVGHAVRATYQYAAMAEVESLLGTSDYRKALDAIWHNIVDTKMHITGGLGAVHGIEGFGPSYVLPNKDTYLETCAAVGNVFFNMRMFLNFGDAKYVDVAEIALLNNSLSGIGLDATSFFYPNPLEADYWHAPRSEWFGTACCPANITRLIPQVPQYMYATGKESIYCLLYGGNTAEVEVGTNKAAIKQATQYPFEGKIEFEINPKKPTRFSFNLRIPTWAGNQLVPGKLYSYAEPSKGWKLTVNGQPVDAPVENGFVKLMRTWKAGDRVVLDLPMPVKANTCIDEVEANHGRVSFSRGPLVLCGEGIDNGGAVQRFFVDPMVAERHAAVSSFDQGIMAGLPMITIPAKELKLEDATPSASLKLIPYFAWSNRDRSSMNTWFATSKALAQKDPRDPNNMMIPGGITASYTCELDSVEALNVRNSPKSSSDNLQRWTSWPQKGKLQWVEINLGKPQVIRSVGVYWYDDGHGVQRPGKWHLEVPIHGKWKKLPIYNTDQYSTLENVYNTVHPARTLTTDRFRIVMTPQNNDTCLGILSVDIDVK